MKQRKPVSDRRLRTAALVWEKTNIRMKPIPGFMLVDSNAIPISSFLHSVPPKRFKLHNGERVVPVEIREREPSLNDPMYQLYRAVIRYIESRGGKLAVISGIQIQRWPGEFAGNFVVGVKCCGELDESKMVESPKPRRATAHSKSCLALTAGSLGDDLCDCPAREKRVQPRRRGPDVRLDGMATEMKGQTTWV